MKKIKVLIKLFQNPTAWGIYDGSIGAVRGCYPCFGIPFGARGRRATAGPRQGRSFQTYILIFVVLFTFSCAVRTKPGKVWNLRDKVVTLSKSLTGLPYKYGGDDIDGFDCSGFVYYVYGSFGMEVPRTAKKQGKLKSKVKFKKAKPGDILVFKLKRRRWHSGILINKKYFIHAPNRKEAVREEYLNSYWRSRLRAVISIINE